MTTLNVVDALKDAGYELHFISDEYGLPCLLGAHTNGSNSSHVYAEMFEGAPQLVTEDVAGHHEVYTPSTTTGLLAAAKLAAAHVDAVVPS